MTSYTPWTRLDAPVANKPHIQIRRTRLGLVVNMTMTSDHEVTEETIREVYHPRTKRWMRGIMDRAHERGHWNTWEA